MPNDLRPEDLGDLLELPIIAVLATRRLDDSIMLSPVWFEWRDGGFNVWVPSAEDGKVRHLRRDPRATIVVADAKWPYRGIEVRGEASISADGFYDVVRRTGDRFRGPGHGDRMAASFAPGVVVRIEPGALRAWAYEDDV